ncbi:MAG: tetratricopeptide repeat protein [Pseudomonadota bacterium]
MPSDAPPADVRIAWEKAVRAHGDGRLAEAAGLFEQVLALAPGNADAVQRLGVIALQTGQAEVAVTLLEEATSRNPAVAPWQFNLGVALQQSDRPADAANAYRAALALRPDYRQAAENLGVVLADLGERAAARSVLEHALSLAPDSTLAALNLATVAMADGDDAAAGRLLDDVLEREPANATAALKLSSVLLRRGDFDAGWRRYEQRLHAPDFLNETPLASVPLPVWDGRRLDGKTLYVLAEQGIGDEIMFAGLLPRAAARCDAVIVRAAPRLVPLLERSFPDLDIVAADDDAIPAAADFRVFAGSLPYRLGVGADEPPAPPYLAADAAVVRNLRERLAGYGDGPFIGISWAGGADPRAQAERRAPAAAWRPLLDGGFVFVDVQYGEHPAERDALAQTGARVIRLADVDPLTDMDTFAALLAALDCVVSVDNSTAHLAAALGTRTAILLPRVAERRWLQGRRDTLWYRAATLYRASGAGADGFADAIAAVRDDLDAMPAAAPGAATQPSVRRSRAGATHGDVVLLNDTSAWYHWGSSCTSAGLAGLWSDTARLVPFATRSLSALPAPPEVDGWGEAAGVDALRASAPRLAAALERAGRVIVNGEGTLHGAGKDALNLLYLMAVASRGFGKPVECLNHSCYPPVGDGDTGVIADIYRWVYEGLARIVIREPVSAERMSELGLTVERGFDCLALFADRHEARLEPRPARGNVLIAGAVNWDRDFLETLGRFVSRTHAEGRPVEFLFGAAANVAADDVALVAALRQVCPGEVTLRKVDTEFAWLEAIAGAALLVSGRFHHTLAAAWYGTPFVATGSNTPKIGAVLEELGLAARLSRGREALAQTLSQPFEVLRDGPSLDDGQRRKLLSLARVNGPA